MAAPIQRTGPGTRTLGRPAIGRGGAKSESPAPRRRSGRRTRRALDVELREDAPRRGYVASEAARVDDWLRNGPGRIRAGYGEPGGAHPARREQRAGREGRVLREATRPPPPTARPPGGVELPLGPCTGPAAPEAAPAPLPSCAPSAEYVESQIARIERRHFRRIAPNREVLNKTPNRELPINLARHLWCSGNGRRL